MENIEIISLTSKKDLFKLLIKCQAKYVGHGKTSCCFLLKDGTILKIYKETRAKKELFDRFSMLEHIKLLGTLKNDSYITPEVIFVCNGEVVAYKTEYRNAKTLAKINPNTRISDFLANLEKLIEDTYLIGEKNFRLVDLHNRNILFNTFFYIIDLDFGYTQESSIDKVNMINIRNIIELLLNTLFMVNDDELLEINEPSIFNIYNKTINEDYKHIYYFFDALKDRLNVSDLQVKDLRLKYDGFILKKYNSYYRVL